MPMDDEIKITIWDDDVKCSTRSLDPLKMDDYRKQSLHLAGLGCTNREIADMFEIATSTLEKHFQNELSLGRAHLKSSLRKAQVTSAIKDRNVQMQIWLGKNFLDQKDSRQEIAHTGSPIAVEKVEFRDEPSKS